MILVVSWWVRSSVVGWAKSFWSYFEVKVILKHTSCLSCLKSDHLHSSICTLLPLDRKSRKVKGGNKRKCFCAQAGWDWGQPQQLIRHHQSHSQLCQPHEALVQAMLTCSEFFHILRALMHRIWLSSHSCVLYYSAPTPSLHFNWPL